VTSSSHASCNKIIIKILISPFSSQTKPPWIPGLQAGADPGFCNGVQVERPRREYRAPQQVQLNQAAQKFISRLKQLLWVWGRARAPCAPLWIRSCLQDSQFSPRVSHEYENSSVRGGWAELIPRSALSPYSCVASYGTLGHVHHPLDFQQFHY